MVSYASRCPLHIQIHVYRENTYGSSTAKLVQPVLLACPFNEGDLGFLNEGVRQYLAIYLAMDVNCHVTCTEVCRALFKAEQD